MTIENIQTIILAVLLLVVGTCRMVEWMRKQETKRKRERITNNSRRGMALIL